MTTTTSNSVNVSLITLDGADPTKTSWGARLIDQRFFVLATGTSADETFDAADIASATATLMATNGRGVSVDMGAGNDTVVGSAYGDNITGGAGTNYIDGGANGGTQPDGSKAFDVLDVYVANAAAANAVAIVALDSSSTGADAAAFAGGYTYKVTNGSDETNYIKNIEQIVFRSTTDRSFLSAIDLAVNVREVASGADLTNYMHLAWAEGAQFGGSFNATTDVSSATQALMATQGRGVFVHMGSGNDTVTGSAYGDNIDVGAGVNYVDGGANGGSPPWGGPAEDVLQMTVASQAAFDALQVLTLTGTGSATDIAAFGNGYLTKIVDATGGQTNYVKGIERVSVQIQSGNTTTVRDIALSVVTREVALTDSNLANYDKLAWVNGTNGNDTIDASGNTALLSTALKAEMSTSQRGVWIDGGTGNDTITGTGYADTIRNGSGNAKVDGGANAHGTGRMDKDIFEIEVASSAAMDAIVVSASDDPDYTWMVTYGSGSTQKDYLKNIEAVSIFVTGGGGKWLPLAAIVNEVSASADATNYMHLAWVNGSDLGDTFNASTDVSAATQALMATNGRGVYVNLGAGNDTVTGSAYGDYIDVGSGTNYVDGGANGGSPPWGGKAEDVLQMTVASQAASDALQVTVLTASGGSATDNTAFSNGYTHKVVDAVGNQVNYIKGIERVSVMINDGSTTSFGRNIPLAVSVREANLSDSNSANYFQVAWVEGTGSDDTIDLGGDSALLSTALKTNMASTHRGVWVDGGAGNDTITGTGAPDNFVNGSGDSRIDGGANVGTGGRVGQDIFQINVATTAAMNAIVIAASDDPNYTWMITYGSGSSQKDYLKNIEAVSISVSGGGVGKWVPLALSINEVSAGTDVTNYMHMAWVNGTDLADSFNATTDISTATQALMTANTRGVYVNTGAGNDTVVGSAYGDNFDVGSGTNYVDGGANTGTASFGGKAEDVLQMTVASQAALDALQVTSLSASGGSATDNTAFGNGYTHKIVDATGNQINYVKGIERVSVMIYDGTTYTFGRDIALAVSVREANLSDANAANYYQVAWVQGTDSADTIDLGGDSALLSTALKTNMASTHRGVWVDGGAGNDTITGTGAPDNFVNGTGNAKIDGGANVSAGGRIGQDVFQINVATTAAMNAIVVSASDDPNYTWMVTYGSGSSQKDYLKNIEAISVNVANGGVGKWIPLALSINEVAAGAEAANYMHLAWVNGTDLADSFNATTDISSATQALMTANTRGVYVSTGAGNDTVVGSPYGDNIDVGSGTNYVDGGANGGTTPWGSKAEDVLQMMVASQAALNGLQVTTLSASGGSATDNTAFSNGYTHKIVDSVGNQINYVKGIERVSVTVYDGTTYSFGKDIALAISVRELNLADANAANFSQVAWVNGTSSDDTIDLSGDSALLSSALKTNMASTHRGVWVDGGAGNDTIMGTAAEDFFVNGTGNARIDGGAQVRADGKAGQDVFMINVDSVAALNAVAVTASDDPNYTWMVTYGSGSTQKDYLKNIESVIVVGGNTSRSFTLAPSISEVTSASNLDNFWYLAFVQGTSIGDAFDAATDISPATRDLMAAKGRGVYVDMGAGNDTVTGSAYIDSIDVGAGTNYVDGGANSGTQKAGMASGDELRMTVASLAALNAVQVTVLTGTIGSSADVDAFNNGYTHKIVDAAGGQINYVKNIELLNILAKDGTSFVGGKQFILSLTVVEMDLTSPYAATASHLAGAQGTDIAETIDFSGDTSLLSATIKSAMSTTKRGITINGNGGDDVITGTAYGDVIMNGSGSAKIDGGNQLSVGGVVSLSSYAGVDVFNIKVASEAEVAAIKVIASDDPAYEWMVTYGTSSTQKDYLRNIELVTISVGETSKSKLIPLKLLIQETQESVGTGTLSSGYWLTLVNGTVAADSFNATTDLTSTVRALMQTWGHGVSVSMGDGNDTVVGSDYIDNVEVGSGVNYVDGGKQMGRLSSGAPSGDNLDVYVTSQAQADAVSVVPLSAASTGVDASAFAAGYQFKVTNGSSETDYVKNIESVSIYVWNDMDHDTIRFRWYSADRNEITLARQVRLGIGVTEVMVDSGNPTRTTTGNDLSNMINMAWASGSEWNDTFDAATDVTAATRAVMATYKKGAYIETFAGNDTITGTPYGDTIIPGSGINYIDGGANDGGGVNAAFAQDQIQVIVAGANAAAATTLTRLDATMTGADLAAFNAGYTFKFANGATEIDYLKNIENITVKVWNDSNGDGIVTGNEITNGASTMLAVQLWPRGDGAAGFANAVGTPFDDVIDLSALAPGIAVTAQGGEATPGSGNDVVTGTAGRDYVDASGGNDTINGGTGVDTVLYRLSIGYSSLSYSVRADGTPVIQQDGIDILTLVKQADGTILVTGLAGTAGAAFGTESLSNVEALLVTSIANNGTAQLTVPIAPVATHLPAGLAGIFTGSALDDVLNGPAEYPGVVNPGVNNPQGTRAVNFNPGNGNDIVIGTVGSDRITASPGNDTIDGGDSIGDTLYFGLASGNGDLSGQVNSDGKLLIQRDGTTIFTVTENSNGSFLVAGVAGTEGASFGTELVSNVEALTFYRPQVDNVDIGSYLTTGLVARSFFGPSNEAIYVGSFRNDTINLATAFPSLSGTAGVFASPGIGDDSVTGTAGNDFFYASSGADSIDGAAGTDTLEFDLSWLAPASNIVHETAANGDRTLSLNGSVVLTLHAEADGATLITGSGAAAGIGTELARNVETFTADMIVNLQGALMSIDMLTGARYFTGSDENDNLFGSTGDDTFVASAGLDYVDGGAGNDSLLFNYSVSSGNLNLRTALGVHSGDIEVMDGDRFFMTLHRQEDGKIWVTGHNENVAAYGVELLNNVETLNISYYQDGNVVVLGINLANVLFNA